jgi:hypothetical protein
VGNGKDRGRFNPRAREGRDYAMWAALRGENEIRVPFEAEAEVYISDDPLDGTRTVKLWQTEVTIQEPAIWPELAAVPQIDWLRPASPIDYVPFSPSQVITGQQHYTTTVGDGSATVFAIAHGLDTEEIAGITLRENSSGGAVVTTGWSAVVTDENTVTLTFDSAPTTAEFAVVITAAGPTSAFQAHTHTIAQITNLEDILDDLGSRVTVLEAILPSTGPGATAAAGPGSVIVIPDTTEAINFRGEVEFDEKVGLTGLPSRPPLLLPAVHDGTVETLPDPLPAVAAGSVWKNETASPVLIPGGFGIRSSRVEPDGFVASDGRILYPARRWASTNSYYPISFERTLFAFALNDKMFAVNRTMECTFGLLVQMLNANCKAQWVVSIELGTFTAETNPATLGLNLENVVWGAPVVEQAIVLSRLVQTHFFGLRIKRLTASFTMDRQLYGIWSGANDDAPSTANLAIRARLTRFDTENVDDPRGWVGYKIIGPSTTNAAGETRTAPAEARIF